MSYGDGILHGFGASTSDRGLLVCYFASEGSLERTEQFPSVLASTVASPLLPLTFVWQSYVHNPTVEIWGNAGG